SSWSSEEPPPWSSSSMEPMSSSSSELRSSSSSSSSSSEEGGLLRKKPSKRGTRVARNARAAEPRGKRVALLAPDVAEEAQVVTQHVWGARPGHRDELILRDRATAAGTSSGSDEPLDERLWCLMDYYDPTAIVDNEGAVVERYRFSAFGLRA